MQSKLQGMRLSNYLLLYILTTSVVTKAQNAFKGALEVKLLTSQIDGDQSGGYNKFGGTISLNVIYQTKGLNYVLKMGASERGSRRNIALEPGVPMHLRFRTADLGLGINKYFDKKWSAGATIICALHISIKDTENYISEAVLKQDTKSLLLLGSLNIGYKLKEKINIVAFGEYSISSIFKNATNNIRYRNGSYFNVLGLGIQLAL